MNAGRMGKSSRPSDERDSGEVGTQYMLIAMAVVEIGGLVYLALAA